MKSSKIDIPEQIYGDNEIRNISRFSEENPNPVFRVAANGTITYANLGSQPLMKMCGGVGQPVPQKMKEHFDSVLKTGKLKKIELECNNRFYSLTLAPNVDEEYVNVYGNDVTELKKADEKTRTSEERFRSLAQSASDAIINISSDGKIVFWNKAAEKIFGYSSGEVIGNPLTKVMPDGFRKAHAEGIIRVVSTGETHIIGSVVEVNGLRKNGSEFPMDLSLAKWETDEGIFFTGIARDITDRKQDEEVIRLNSQMMANINDGILLYQASDGKIVYSNTQFENLFGYEKGELDGKPVSMLNAHADKPPQEVSDEIEQSMINNGVWEDDIQNTKKDGTCFWCHANISSFIHSEFGLVRLGVQQDITERKQAELELEHLGTHDSLTGLYNRTFFDEEMNRLEKGRQFPITIMMADVDDLKKANDDKGHLAGDKLLKRTAQVLNDSFRGDDIVARIGGDEFAVLLPNTNEIAAKEALKRIRNNLKKNNSAETGTDLSISLGISTVEKGTELKNALQQADKNMYQDKKKKKSK